MTDFVCILVTYLAHYSSRIRERNEIPFEKKCNLKSSQITIQIEQRLK